MNKRFSLAVGSLTVWAIALAMVLFFVTPALAHHRSGHDNGGNGQAQSQGKGGGNGSDSELDESNDGDADDDTDPNVDDDDNAHPSGKDRSEEPGGSGNQGKAKSDPDDDGRGPDRSNGGVDQPGGSGGTDKSDQDGNNGCGNDDDFEDDNEGLCLGRQGPKGPKAGDVGNSESQMTIAADCFSVHVTSSKDISFVEVTFADGTTIKFDGLRGNEFTRSFDKEVRSARAKAGTTIVSDTVTEDCAEVGPGVIVNPAVPEAEEVEEEEEEDVLGVRISRAAPEAQAGPGVSAQAAEAEGAVLPFTGAGIAGFLLMALGLISSGTILTRIRR